MISLGTLSGTVTDFDEERGLGTIRGDDGEERRFHCTQIDDGSRTVDVGAGVTFTVVAGRMGQWEAGRIQKR